MGEVVRDLEGKHKYLYKTKVVSARGKEYWRYYPPRWREGPVISRVKLDPEQAVLSCCYIGDPDIKTSGAFNLCGAYGFACTQYPSAASS